MYLDWSRMICGADVGGQLAAQLRRESRLTPSMTATVLASDWRMTSSVTVGSPLSVAIGALLRGAVLGVAEVADTHRHAVDRAHDEIVEATGIDEAPGGAQGELAVGRGDVAAGHVGVLCGDGVAHRGDRQAVGIEPVGVDPHVHGSREAALERHLADARRPLETDAHDFVGNLGQLAHGARARDRDDDHRLRVAVELRDHRRVGVFGKVAHRARHAVAHVLRGEIDLAVEIEVGDHERSIGHRDRAQLVDALHGVHRLLDAVGELGLDLGRVRRPAGWSAPARSEYRPTASGRRRAARG